MTPLILFGGGVDLYFGAQGGFSIIGGAGITGGTPAEMHGGICQGLVVPKGNLIVDVCKGIVAIDKAINNAVDAIGDTISDAIDSLTGEEETKSKK